MKEETRRKLSTIEFFDLFTYLCIFWVFPSSSCFLAKLHCCAVVLCVVLGTPTVAFMLWPNSSVCSSLHIGFGSGFHPTNLCNMIYIYKYVWIVCVFSQTLSGSLNRCNLGEGKDIEWRNKTFKIYSIILLVKKKNHSIQSTCIYFPSNHCFITQSISVQPICCVLANQLTVIDHTDPSLYVFKYEGQK